MIVARMTVKAKWGHRDEVADLVLSELVAQKERGNYARPFRVYTPEFSGQSSNVLILEWEYEDLAERDKMWTEWLALPTTPAYLEKWGELVDPYQVSEIWNVRTP